MKKKMVMPHFKSIKSSPLHCSHWKSGSGFYSPHGKIVLSFAPLVYNSLNAQQFATDLYETEGNLGCLGAFLKEDAPVDTHSGSSDFL